MKFLDRQLVAFMGDSLTEHLVAVNDWMETQTDGLPPVGTPLHVDRHENRGWTTLLENRIHLTYPERQIRYINAGVGVTVRVKCLRALMRMSLLISHIGCY